MKNAVSKPVPKVKSLDMFLKHILILFLDEDILPTLIAILEGGIEMVRRGEYMVSTFVDVDVNPQI
jgi:hypothetical protein